MHPNGQLPGVRVGVRRREPAGARLGGAAGVRDRRRPRPRLPRAGVPQAAAQLHLVGQPQGRRRATTSSRAASSGWTTSGRSTGRRCCRWPGTLEQSDGTAWMAHVLPEPARDGARARRARPRLRGHRDQVLRALRLHRRRRCASKGLWDEDGRLLLRRPRASPTAPQLPLRVRSMVGLLPLTAATTLGAATLARLPELRGPARLVRASTGRSTGESSARRTTAADGAGRLLSVVDADRLRADLSTDARRGRVPLAARPAVAVAPAPRRSRSRSTLGGRRRHGRLRAGRVATGAVRRQLELARAGVVPGQLPARSRRCAASRRSTATTCTSSTRPARATGCTLARGRRRPGRRLVGLFLATPTAAGPCFGADELLQPTRAGTTSCSFHEYFHGDTGAGLGASHQTGWTALVADLILRRGPEVG